MNYIFTKNGERKVENFIQSCIEKRKKIINEGIDTGDLVDNAGKLSINDVLLSINYFHTSVESDLSDLMCSARRHTSRNMNLRQ